jgi:hypothetical protein
LFSGLGVLGVLGGESLNRNSGECPKFEIEPPRTPNVRSEEGFQNADIKMQSAE